MKPVKYNSQSLSSTEPPFFIHTNDLLVCHAFKMLLIKYLQALDSMYFTKFIKQMSEHAGFLNALFNVKPCRSEAVFLLFMFFGTFPPLFLYIKDVFLQFQTSLKSCVVWVRLEWMRGARLFVILSLYCWTWQQNINFLFLFFVHFRQW